ncbi:XapX domain-containing protein [Streptomyces glaucescens]
MSAAGGDTRPRSPCTVAFLRAAAVSFAAGLLMGAVYRLLDIRSPAPPLLGLTGLFGIVVGERAVQAVRGRWRRRVSAARDEDPAPEKDSHP